MKILGRLPTLVAIAVCVIIVIIAAKQLISTNEIKPLLVTQATTIPVAALQTTIITVPKGKITVEIATSSADQEEGLGGRDNLAADHGMLFVFSKPGTYGFWMKDMKFDLDMVWVNDQKKVIGVATDVPAHSYPTVYWPPGNISYTIELPSDDVQKYGIATGTVLMFQIPN